jgi:hypothetical protein
MGVWYHYSMPLACINTYNNRGGRSGVLSYQAPSDHDDRLAISGFKLKNRLLSCRAGFCRKEEKTWSNKLHIAGHTTIGKELGGGRGVQVVPCRGPTMPHTGDYPHYRDWLSEP